MVAGPVLARERQVGPGSFLVRAGAGGAPALVLCLHGPLPVMGITVAYRVCVVARHTLFCAS